MRFDFLKCPWYTEKNILLDVYLIRILIPVLKVNDD